MVTPLLIVCHVIEEGRRTDGLSDVCELGLAVIRDNKRRKLHVRTLPVSALPCPGDGSKQTLR